MELCFRVLPLRQLLKQPLQRQKSSDLELVDAIN